MKRIDDSNGDFHKTLKSAAKELDLDYDKFEALTVRLSGLKADNARNATRMSRVLEAIKQRDAETFYNVLIDRESITWKQRREIDQKEGVLGSFQDLIGACTKNRVCNAHDGYLGHTTSYYKARHQAQYTEMFANLYDAYGYQDPLMFEIFEKFVPNAARIFREIISESI